MSNYAAEHDALLKAFNAARPEVALGILTDVVALAERNNDPAAAEEATVARVRLANQLGDFATEFAAFEQLARWHAAGRSNLRDAVLWYYKWIAEHLHEFASLSRDQIGAFFDRMEACFRAEGAGLRPLYGYRMAEAAFAGQPVEADAWRTRWESEPEAKSDDCAACETHLLVETLLYLGRADDAIEAAEPILKGEQACDEVPHTTLSRLLLPLVRNQNIELAEIGHRFSRRYVRRVPKMLRYLADHVTYLSILGRSDEAARLVAVMLVRAEQSRNGLDRYRAAVAAWVWASGRQAAGQNRLRVPKRLTWPAQHDLPVGDFIANYQAIAIDLAGQFDARNGNGVFAERLQTADKLATFAARPLSPGASGRLA